MSTTNELISQVAAALPLASLLFCGTGQAGAPPGRLVRRPSRGSALARRLRGLAGQAAAWRERRADFRRLARMSDRDLADIGLHRSETGRAFGPGFMLGDAPGRGRTTPRSSAGH